MKSKLITCFQDTLQFSKCQLSENTMASIKSNKVYKENFVSMIARKDEQAIVRVYEGTTFDNAKNHCKFGRVAVLNFANQEYPGGGVANGAMAQEECLCRSSNLYACISDENVFEEYYGYHRGFDNYFYSDRLIYTKDVTVFKNDDIVPQLLPEDEWFKVDVITCAAPYIAKRKYTNSTALLSLFKKRIKNIFEVARENQVDVIVLGAFGCGAFKNPPIIVAEAFKQIMCEENYFTEFKYIVFAIKPTGEECANLSTFVRHFDEYAAELEGRTGLLPMAPEWRFTRIPELPKMRHLSEGKDFTSWQRGNKYYGKQFSIVGDSISTLDGYNPRGYKVFYAGGNSEKSGVINVQDTWWDKVIGYFGGELLINNSWSGSRVTKLPDSEEMFPSGCSNERTSSLHINDVKPDVIIVYLGTNDWTFGVLTGGRTSLFGDQDNEFFEYAYANMLEKLKTNYPNSEIWCCTLSTTCISSRPDFTFPYTHAGTHIETYNRIIRDIVKEYDCNLIDLCAYNMPYDSIDGIHPSSDGMNTIAKMVIEAIIESEYVRLGSNITPIFYSNKIKLTVESNGKEVQFRNNIISVGQARGSDLILEGKTAISRQHATFYYEDETWFLKDNNSKNGTWLNGILIQSGKKYQLAADDVIDLAHSETLIFYKTENHFEQSSNVEKDNIDRVEEDGFVTTDLIGVIIEDRYTVLELIHDGPVTKIYRVRDERLNKYWTMTYYNKVENNNFDMVYQSIMSEVQLVMKLDHPMIPRIVDIIENSWATFIVREYVEGDDLEAIIKAQGPQSIDKVIDWGKQLCDVLTYLHTLSQPHIHRDIKPANIILMPDGRIKLIDFGIMRLYKPNKLADTCCLGTKDYAAPEQFGGRQTDARTDIYGLGMTLHHLITGIDPKLPLYETKPIRKVNPSLPVGLEYIISKCVEFNPDDRYQNCYELKKDLDNYLSISPKKTKGIFNKLFKK